MSDKILKSGPLFEPRLVRHWKPRPGQCRASVIGDGYRGHQCANKAKVTRTVEVSSDVVEEVEYCGIHDPVKVEEKRKAREAKWRAAWKAQAEARAQAERSRQFREACIKAIKSIAAGHNDPRALAAETLAKFQEDRPDAD